MEHERAEAESGDARAAIDFMRRQPLFQDLAEADLVRLHELSSTRRLPAGAVAMRQGDPGEEMFIVMAGELEVSWHHGGEDEYLATRGVGDVLGEMALLGGEPRSATVTATSDAHLLVIGRDAFATLLACSGTAALTILNTVAQRLRSSESRLMQQEKLASLGTMAAGLAHELNNPAAAVGRSLGQLRDAWDEWQEAALALSAFDWAPGQADRLRGLRDDEATAREEASAADASSREEALASWLEDEGIEPSWRLAPALADRGRSAERLAAHLADFPADRRPHLVRWLATCDEIHGLLDTGEAGARAISAIVGAVRDYAYLDRAPLQDVDVRKGLDDTLLMLRARLKGGIEVVRDYADDLPTIPAYGSELNQVWTNLIGNAIDAMDGRGRLRLHASRRGDAVRVTICDDGPGIPTEVLPRIFEPFFTTKPVGSGNGLGLHIAYDLIVRRHLGRLHVRSKPGSTCFEALLPLAARDPAARRGGAAGGAMGRAGGGSG